MYSRAALSGAIEIDEQAATEAVEVDRAHTLRVGPITMWRDACVRGTGFASRRLLDFAAERSARLIDAALATAADGAAWAAARTSLEAAFEADARRIGEHLRDVARDPRVREAVTWQNRDALHFGFDKLLRAPVERRDAGTRKLERIVASYLQRYFAKNETIGFFGPVGWATLDPAYDGVRQLPGPRVLARRTVYFERWAIDALATHLSADRALRASLAPRRMPTVRLDGDRLHHPIDRVTELPPAMAWLVARCDGVRTATELAEAALAVPGLELATVEDVFDLLDELVAAKVVLWRLEVPTAGFEPERVVRTQLEQVSPGAARDAALAALAELEAARAGVAAAAGDADALDAALAALEATFVRITDGEATRHAGRIYAGRGLVFEDCRRDVEIVLGRPFLERIAAPLGLVQASARWFSYTVMTRLRAIFERVYRDLVAETGAAEIDMVRYYVALKPHLSSQVGAMSATVRDVRDELHRRWAAVLDLPTGARRVALSAAALAPKVEAAFAAPGPGWPSARHTSPDLMIAAAGPDALARGELLVVLGEVHAAVNAVTVPTLAKEHVDPARLFRAHRTDIGPAVAKVEPRANTHRASTYSMTDGDVDIELGDARSRRPRSHVHDIAGFVVVEHAGQLRVQRRDGTAPFDLIAFLDGDLTAESYTFDMFGDAAHRPRVTIDDLVVARERWRFEPAELAFATRATPFERFAGARQWARAQALPRFLFVKSPAEPKPYYLDLESPLFVELLCKLVRAGQPITVSEMLPSLDELWLVDAEGTAYCGELRTVLVDDAPLAG